MSVRSSSRGSVVLHADDFGMNASVNEGILKSLREGLLTSTSLLANAPAAEQACAAWASLDKERAEGRLHSREPRLELGDTSKPFDLGIHLNLTQGRPLTGASYPSELLDEHGQFPGVGPLFSKIRGLRADALSRVEKELCAQIEWMLDRGIRPTHLNGHQYVEIMPRISQSIPDLLRRYQIPVVRVALERRIWKTVFWKGRFTAWLGGVAKRFYSKRFRRLIVRNQIPHPDRFYGTCHAGCVTLELLSEFVRHAPWHHCTEIGLHPATADAGLNLPRTDAWHDPLAESRSSELQWLCSADLRDLLVQHKVKLGRLHEL